MPIVNLSKHKMWLLCSLLVFVATISHAKSVQNMQIQKVKQVTLALYLYADDHQGKLPHHLEQLIPSYLSDRSLLAGFCYLPSYETDLHSLPVRSALLVWGEWPTASVIVGFADRSVEIIHPEVHPTSLSNTIIDFPFVSICAAASGWLVAAVVWIFSYFKKKPSK